jgi:hypothetical protein
MRLAGQNGGSTSTPSLTRLKFGAGRWGLQPADLGRRLLLPRWALVAIRAGDNGRALDVAHGSASQGRRCPTRYEQIVLRAGRLHTVS